MAETDTKVDIPKENPEADNTIKPEKEKVSPEPEKSSKKDKKSKKEKKSKKNRSRSRSESESTDESKDRSSGSRSKSRSHRRKHSKKSKKHRKRSVSESRSRSGSHRRRSRKEHRHESSYRRRDHRDRRERDDRREKDYDRDRNRDNGKDREKDREKDRDRRSRTRSPHPLLKGKVQEVPVKSKIDDANKSKMFWDGFQWVAKANTVAATADPAHLTQTKKMRRLNISNLPLSLGLGDREIGEFVTKFIIENYLNDEGNYQPVREVTIDSSRNSATVELSSVEEASRLAKVETIKILGHNCLVSREGSKFGATTNLATLVTEAQRTAQAQAAVLAAMSMLQNKDNNTSFTLSKVNVLANASKVLKVANLIDVDQVRDNLNQELNDVLEDIKEEFGNFGSVKDAFIVKPEKTVQGAEAGTVFITFESESQAEKALNSMANKRYDAREIRVTYIDEDTYNKNFAGLKTA